MGVEKRRSDRVMLTLPLRVQGTDRKGVGFDEDARTVTLNRHGARIQVSGSLRSGQTVRLVNLIRHHEAEFRVVGPVSPFVEKGGEWGVECLDARDNLWGIHFPPLEEGEAADSKAILECRECHTVALMRLSLVEVEVLETAGILSKVCLNCEMSTPWGYAEKQTGMEGLPAETVAVAQTPAVATGADLRRHRRVSLQLPVLIRDYYGGVEIAKSENVSRSGFCFTSEKTYFAGQGVMVICPYSTTAENIEVRARIVRRQDLEATNRRIYGLRNHPPDS